MLENQTSSRRRRAWGRAQDVAAGAVHVSRYCFRAAGLVRAAHFLLARLDVERARPRSALSGMPVTTAFGSSLGRLQVLRASCWHPLENWLPGAGHPVRSKCCALCFSYPVSFSEMASLGSNLWWLGAHCLTGQSVSTKRWQRRRVKSVN